MVQRLYNVEDLIGVIDGVMHGFEYLGVVEGVLWVLDVLERVPFALEFVFVF
jgi:hypothetical protein